MGMTVVCAQKWKCEWVANSVCVRVRVCECECVSVHYFIVVSDCVSGVRVCVCLLSSAISSWLKEVIQPEFRVAYLSCV